MTTAPDLEGTLIAFPALRPDLLEVVADEYAALADEYGPRNVLVLKRLPAGLERLREALSTVETETGAARSARVESVPEHASKVIEEYDPTLDRLSYEERIELLSMVVAGANRELPEYLERARDHDSFARDVGQLLLEATRQRIRLDELETEEIHPCLEFLYATNDRFHEELARRGYLERADVIPRAVSLLEDDADELRTRVCSSFDAVLAVEFEECRRLDRRYLAALSADADLVCLGERHASVERARVEVGSLEEIAAGLTPESREEGVPSSDPTSERRDRPTPDHRPITRWLATGSTGDEPGSARRIRAGTAREQDRQVATEIQTLLSRHDWRYDDVAVAVPTVERVPDARSHLRDAGIPTATVGTPALEQDPAVNELYAFVAYNADYDRERARDRLAARVPEFSPALVADCVGSSLRRSLERWVVATELKGRLAREEVWVDARESFENVRRVLAIARFVEDTDAVAPDWDGLRRMLRRTIEYDAPYAHDVETSPDSGGVTVCAVTDLKYDRREVVFLLDLVERQYPGEQHLTQLFPQPWLESMPAYPAVTDPSPADVDRTFTPVDADEVGNAFEAYHAERARRRLAIGTRAARSRLYLCSYEREAGGLRRTREESRYVRLLASHPEITLEDVDARARRAAIDGDARALEALLAEPRGELERVLREASTGGEADLAETEALFEEIALVLAEGAVDPELANAVRSGFEFAAGEVCRDE